jgi:monothiol glutaredoxin
MAHNPFQIMDNPPVSKGQAVAESDGQGTLEQRLERLIKSSDVFLFMKGTAQMPQCGFSASAVRILDSYNIPFKTFDILSNPEIRQGVKEYANWPTYPQLWVKAELMGGNDVMVEMHQSGELKQILSALKA